MALRVVRLLQLAGSSSILVPSPSPFLHTMKAYILRRLFSLHVLALNYCHSTLCQYVEVGKFAHDLALLRL
jgi:hypothetical protein